ncbi:MAG: DNA topoisomerase IB [Candidatus Levybacteria bacterium]|nr:DNA topoisomerase IB [Candidatus Levybacteria bacterium]
MTDNDFLKNTNLRYSTDKKPGYTRKRVRNTFEYFDTEGKKITDKKVVDRIQKLAIPPAYKNVWICSHANGHLQATGYDARGRKQYRYNPLWNQISQQEKFSHLLEFAQHLPKIRATVKQDLTLMGIQRRKVISAVVWLLENTLIRIGNEEYERENKSYGLTTLKNKHASVSYKSNIVFQFKGKSGVYHNVSIKNKKVAKIVRRCKELPGQDLFEYKDEEGIIQSISSQDVNTYLQEITGAEITAKDFRTWGGTVLAATAFDKAGIPAQEEDSKKNIVEIVKKVASHLRNKPNTCRKYYIHPHVIDAYIKGSILSNWEKMANAKKLKKIDGLDNEENKVVAMITGIMS